MISATFFGEVTELQSRAIWYSDEEDDDDEDTEQGARPSKAQSPKPLSHEACRSNVRLEFRVAVDINKFKEFKFSSCVVSVASASQFKLGESSENLPLQHLIATGHVDPTSLQPIARAYAFPSSYTTKNTNNSDNNSILWVVLDAGHRCISGYQVGYFVESLWQQLQTQFNIAENIIILSQQFSSGESLEYLVNNKSVSQSGQSFQGKYMLPPSLVKNHFEAALFELLTISIKTCTVICLPNPRDFWFNAEENWPKIPKAIVEHRLTGVYKDLEKSLIFI